MAASSSPSRPTFAFLLSNLSFGGAERAALNLAKELKLRGWNVTFLLMTRGGEFLEEAEEEFTVVDLRCRKTHHLPGRLRDYLAANDTQILFSSFWKLNLCACLAVVGRSAPRLFLWEHSPPSTSRNSPTVLYALSATLLYRVAEKIVCVSEGVRADVARITRGLGTRLRVIYNPIPPPITLGCALERRQRAREIAWIGRLEEPKNPELMLAAFSLLSAHADLHLTFVGDGSKRASLEKRATELGLANRVRFAGYHPKPWMILRDCALLVLTSDREGFGNVLVEGMYNGLRVVSTDCGSGVHEIVGDQWGTIVPVGDAKLLAEAIILELRKPARADKQRLRAELFSPSRAADEVLSKA